MYYLMVRQQVKDFDQWYAVFSSHVEAHREAGFKDLQLLRDFYDPNSVVCFFKVDDLEMAKAFTGSPDADAAQKAAGVIGTPEVLLLEETGD